MSVSRLGKRRQVVIPKDICDATGLHEGDFVEVTRRNGRIVITPSAKLDLEDTLTPEEEKLVRKGERQLRQGKYVLWDDLKKKLKL